jgi:hypothetical protein
MKPLRLTLIATIVIWTLSSCKKERNETVTVIRDCTGTYLRNYGKDFHVCNPEKVASFENGTEVLSTYKKIRDCNGSAKDAIVCLMVHKNEGWIEVIKIE